MEPLQTALSAPARGQDQLGAAIATLEAVAHGIVTASGLAALTTALTALLPSGGRLIVPHDCYGGSWRLFNQLAGWAGFQVDHIDQTNLPALAQALREPADLMLIETPSNPLLRLVDLAEAIALAHRAGATVLVDNTFCSPIRQRPIDFGADVVMHSTTKFINGHSDVVGGALVVRTAAHGELLAHWANLLGITGSGAAGLFPPGAREHLQQAGQADGARRPQPREGAHPPPGTDIGAQQGQRQHERQEGAHHARARQARQSRAEQEHHGRAPQPGRPPGHRREGDARWMPPSSPTSPTSSRP